MTEGVDRIWYALSVRGGGSLPPRLLKRIWTAKEAQELRLYDQRFPIDDESNHQLMPAVLATIYTNTHIDRNKESPRDVRDFLPFVPKPKEGEPVDLDAKMQAMLSRFKKNPESD